MASSITLKTGPLTATLSSANDATMQTALLRFAHATGADPAWTNQQKLDHVAKELAELIVRVGRDRYIQEESSSIQQAGIDNVHW